MRFHIRPTLCAAVLAALTVAATPATSPVPTGSIAGTVRDAHGKPMVGVTVWLDVPAAVGGHANYARFATGADGTYAFHYLPPTTFGVHEVVPAGYAVQAPVGNLLQPTLAAGQQATGVDFVNAAIPPAAAAPAAVVLPPPVSVPAPAGLACGSPAATTAVYAVGSAPCAGWYSTAAVTATRTDGRLWHLADGTADTLVGQTAVGVYQTPGTYTVTCTVKHPGGSTSTFAQPIVVAPDARPHYYIGPGGNDANAGTATTPFATAAPAAKPVAAGNCRLTFLPGTALTLSSAFTVGSNTAIDGQPDVAGNLPVLTVGPFAAFNVFAKTSNVLVRQVRVTSVGTVTGQVTVAPSVRSARAGVIVTWGHNVVLDGCEFGTLVRAAELDGGDMAVLRCRQVDPRTIWGQVVSAWYPGRLVVDGCTLTGGFAEAIVRTDGIGTGAGLSVEGNWLGQTFPTCAANADKACVDLRSCSGATIAHNQIVNAQLGTSSGHGTVGQSVADLLVSGNTFQSTDGVHPGSTIVSLTGVTTGITLAGNTFASYVPRTTAVGVTPYAGMQDLVVYGNAYAAGLGKVAVMGGATVPGLATDVGVGLAATTRPVP
jgi:PKD repeat protein